MVGVSLFTQSKTHLAIIGIFCIKVAQKFVQNLVLSKFSTLKLRVRLHRVDISKIIDGDDPISSLVHFSKCLADQTQSIL